MTTPRSNEPYIDELILQAGIALPDEPHARLCAGFAATLFDRLHDWLGIYADDRQLAIIAALFHDSGYLRSARDHHRKSLDIILEATLPGVTPEDQIIAACAARYHGHTAPNIEHAGFGDMSFADQHRVRRLIAVVRLAVALDASHLRPIQSVDVVFEDGVPLVRAFASADASVERDRLREAAGSVHHLIERRIRTEVVAQTTEDNHEKLEG